MKGERLGEFEELTLLAAAAMGDGTYAVPVQRYVAAAAMREVPVPAIHAVLRRLEAKGFVQSQMGSPSATRGGKAKRLYRVTPLGLKTARVMHLVRTQMWTEISGKGRL